MAARPSKTIPTFEEALQAVQTILAYIGDDASRAGLAGTPGRVLKAWRDDWGRGYQPFDADQTLTLFETEMEELDTLNLTMNLSQPISFPPRSRLVGWPSKRHNQMIVVKDITMFSTCEHHMAPFWGVAHIGYMPSMLGLVGLSKLARIVDHFSRRLQTQERITEEVADCLANHLSANIAVMIEARHMCMISRGVNQPKSTTITTALRGKFLAKETVRQEFLATVRA